MFLSYQSDVMMCTSGGVEGLSASDREVDQLLIRMLAACISVDLHLRSRTKGS